MIPQNSPSAVVLSYSNAFAWTEVRERALLLVFQGEATETEIAADLGVDRKTLYNWRNHPAFLERLRALVEEYEQMVFAFPIASRARRVERLNARWRQINDLITQRGEDPQMKDVPGGPSGLLVREEKGVGSGLAAKLTDVYRADTALIKEEREIAKQAAIELGQWEEKGAGSSQAHVLVRIDV